jgi:hypothetical protein
MVKRKIATANASSSPLVDPLLARPKNLNKSLGGIQIGVRRPR